MSEEENDGLDLAEIKLLVKVRLGMEEEFACRKRKKSVLWNKVVEEIKKIKKETKINRDNAQRKFFNLLTSYKRIKERMKSGKGRTSWAFFEEFDEVYGNRLDIILPEKVKKTPTCELSSSQPFDQSNFTPYGNKKNESLPQNDSTSSLLQPERAETNCSTPCTRVEMPNQGDNSMDELFVRTIAMLIRDLPTDVKDRFQANMYAEVYRLRAEHRNN